MFHANELFARILGDQASAGVLEFSPLKTAIDLLMAAHVDKNIEIGIVPGRSLFSDQIDDFMRHEGLHLVFGVRRTRGMENGVFDFSLSSSSRSAPVSNIESYARFFSNEELYTFSRSLLHDVRQLRSRSKTSVPQSIDSLTLNAETLAELAIVSNTESLNVASTFQRIIGLKSFSPLHESNLFLGPYAIVSPNGIKIQSSTSMHKFIEWTPSSLEDQALVSVLLDANKATAERVSAKNLLFQKIAAINERNIRFSTEVNRISNQIRQTVESDSLIQSMSEYLATQDRGTQAEAVQTPSQVASLFRAIDELNLLVRQELYPQLRTQAGDSLGVNSSELRP